MAARGNRNGAIIALTDIKRSCDRIERMGGKIINKIIRQLCYIGEKSIKIARKNGNYTDITGNLRSSIGYIVLYNGRVMQYGAPVQKAGKKGNGAAGVKAGKEFIAELQTKYPTGLALILCAGMEYAAYVENIHGRRVLIDAEVEARRLVDKLIGKYVKAK